MENFGPSKVMDPYIDAVGEWLSNTPGQITKLYHIIGTEETPSLFTEVGMYVLLPGERVPVHTHSKGEEFVFTKQGKVILLTDGDRELGIVEERKLVYVPENAAHGYINPTDDPVELLVWTSKEASLRY